MNNWTASIFAIACGWTLLSGVNSIASPTTSGGRLAQQMPSSSRAKTPFASIVDQDDPTSQGLFQELEHLSTQFHKRATSLSLNQAIQQGLFRNPDLSSAFFDIQGSEWNLIAARRSWYPTLQLTGNTASLKGQPNILAGKEYSSITTNPSAQSNSTTLEGEAVAPVLALSWSFFDPTRTPAINQALSSVFAQRFLFDIAARNLILNLQTAYTDVQAESELVQRYKWLFAQTHQQVLDAEEMVREGRLSRTALDQLHTEQRLQLTRLIDRYQLRWSGFSGQLPSLAFEAGHRP